MAVVVISGMWQITCITFAWLNDPQFSGTIYRVVVWSSFIGHVLDGVLVAYRQLDGKCGWIGASVVFWSGSCDWSQKVNGMCNDVGLTWVKAKQSVWSGLICLVRCIGRLSVWNSERFCGLESAVGKLRENERGVRQGGGAARSGGGVTLSQRYLSCIQEGWTWLYDRMTGKSGIIE